MTWQDEDTQELSELGERSLELEKIITNDIRVGIPYNQLRHAVKYGTYEDSVVRIFKISPANTLDYIDYLDSIANPVSDILDRLKRIGVITSVVDPDEEEIMFGFDEGWVFIIDKDRFREHYSLLVQEIKNRLPFDPDLLAIRLINDVLHITTVSGVKKSLKMPRHTQSGKLLMAIYLHWKKNATLKNGNAAIYLTNPVVSKFLTNAKVDMVGRKIKDFIGNARKAIVRQKCEHLIVLHDYDKKNDYYCFEIKTSLIAPTP